MSSQSGSDGKRTPRRLFSFDSIKPSSTQRSSVDSSPSHAPQGVAALPQVDETDRDLVKSPGGPRDDKMSSRSVGSDKSRRAAARRPTPVMVSIPTRPITPDSLPPPSPSRARWEHLRQHVLPLPVRPPTPPLAPPTAPPSLAVPQPRSQTPKPSRLARLGFRQVVEHAREVAGDDTRRFAFEIQKACWSARSTEHHKFKADRELQAGTIGSSLYLPFMSTTSLATGGGTSTANLTHASNKKHEMRRPQSVQSLALSNRAVPSLKQLYQALLHYAAPPGLGLSPYSNLPHESQVLSTLIGPFLYPREGARVDEERWFAIESFELIIKTWSPYDEPGGVERCLWCCTAALSCSPPLRVRVLGVMWELLAPHETCYSATTPQTFQTILQGLYTLLSSLSSSPIGLDMKETMTLNDIISHVRSGSCGDLSVISVEKEYGFDFREDSSRVREELVLEAHTRCLENCPKDTRFWLLQNTLEDSWPVFRQDVKFTPLSSAIRARTLGNFTRASLALLSSDLIISSSRVHIAQDVVHFLQTRVVPEIEFISSKSISEPRSNVVRIALELISTAGTKDVIDWALDMLCHRSYAVPEWKSAVEQTLQQIVATSHWPVIVNVLSCLIKVTPDNVRRSLIAFVLPILSDQLVNDPPEYPCLPLTGLLDTISQLYPQIFYKPLFSCAASSKEFSVVNHLCAITVVSKFLPDYWTRDAEMISVALMSDIGVIKGNSSASDGSPTWGTARLGQSVLLLELISCIQTARHAKEASSVSEASLVDTVKFVLALESRLSILLDAKEQRVLTPPSQRLLFCILFREIRLLTRSLKMGTWLSRVVSWFVNYYAGDILNEDSDLEVTESVERIQGLYAAAQDGVRPSHKRRTTVLFSPTVDHALDEKSAKQNSADISAILAEKAQLIESLSKGFIARAMKVLVAMSSLLTVDDYRYLAPLLWEHELNGDDTSLTTSACFLIMQCAEKAPLDLNAIVEVDLQSSNYDTKLDALRKLSILVNWRFQIMSQHVITDRAHRPFKLARGPLPFVSTDMGSSLFIREDDSQERDAVPLELKKRLAEIGWAQEDTPVDQHREWVKTPMSLLPVHQLDRLEIATPDQDIIPPASPTMSPVSSPQKMDEFGLLRRNSSTGGPSHGMKRRPVFVPSLALIFPRLAKLVFDSNFVVAATAREVIVDLMRNDPGLLTRPVLDLVTGDQKDISVAISTFTAFLHVQQLLPPPMAHNVFNNLAGFLKYAARQADTQESLHEFAHTIPVLAKLVTQVNGMSIREIRRAKVEMFFIPSGTLWFSTASPTGPMFPRGLDINHNPFESVPPSLVSITMIRLSQNMLFLSMLKRNHQDVQLIRKNMSRLVLPLEENQLNPVTLELRDFAPRKAGPSTRVVDVTIRGLSLMLSRSYLLLVAQVFRSMSRHLNDRNELAVLIDGLNRILLTHGDDIGIVSQALIALMVASTRFRRLFTSGGGYTLFMPAVVKIYAESESHPGIRNAIEYAVNRFYALHKEAFVFQSLDIIAHVAMLPYLETEWFAKSVYNLFATLRRGIPPSAPDAAGIHNSNKRQEREALLVSTAEEKPQTFLESLSRREAQQGPHITIDLPEEYETSRLGISDLIRLFLTVIAHDPTIVRAEQFLRLLRFLSPHLYHASSSARSVLQDGIDALGAVLTKVSPKTKAPDVPAVRPTTEGGEPPLSSAIMENQLLDKSRTASDLVSMRLDYLSLIVAFTQAGGQISSSSSHRAFDLVKTILRDSPNNISGTVSRFFTDFTKASLLRESAPSPKAAVAFLRDLAPIISVYATSVDFSGVLEIVSLLATNPAYANDTAFSQVVVSQICAAGLTGCESAASEGLLLTLPCRSSLVSLLTQAVFLHGADVLAEIEKRPPSYDFLAGILLPLVMLLRTGAQAVSDGVRMEHWHRNALSRVWIRLLSYGISACQKSQRSSGSARPIERSKSPEKRRSMDARQSPIPTFVTALQVLKTIIIRAEDDLSSHLPGVWARVALFLKKILAEGSAEFALRPQMPSPLPTPAQSPRNSVQFDPFVHLSISSDLRGPSHERSFISPRIVDYTMWSILELLCVYRSPLVLQMRLFMIEKAAALDQDLRYQLNTPSPTMSGTRRFSAAVFSKPRRRVSGLPSPDSSPRVSASQSFYDTSLPPPNLRQAGYQYTPGSPVSQDTSGPRIVHLGPISNPSSTYRRSLSPGVSADGVQLMAKTTKIKSLALVRATYRRIRTVQSSMGYDVLLPMPHGNEMSAGEAFTTTWTKHQALEAVVRETKELMEEFEESFAHSESDGVLVGADQSMEF